MIPTLDKAIDGARVGLSKSLMVRPCQRSGWYSEHVRDSEGKRLRFAMPEKVHFGSAVDSAHLELVYAASQGKEPDLDLAIAKGMERARQSTASEPIDWDVFRIQLTNAMTLFLTQPDGLARIPLEGIRFQGANGVSLKADDVIGTPDYLLGDGSVLDVKAAARRKTVRDFWRSAEMPIYTWLAATEHGVLPPKVIYQVYVRVTKPYWQWIEIPGVTALIALGQGHADHWRTVLAGPVEGASFSTDFCSDCGYRDAIPDVGHDGCEIGQSVPVTEELEAIAA
jgi:hypothetical protein